MSVAILSTTRVSDRPQRDSKHLFRIGSDDSLTGSGNKQRSSAPVSAAGEDRLAVLTATAASQQKRQRLSAERSSSHHQDASDNMHDSNSRKRKSSSPEPGMRPPPPQRSPDWSRRGGPTPAADKIGAGSSSSGLPSIGAVLGSSSSRFGSKNHSYATANDGYRSSSSAPWSRAESSERGGAGGDGDEKPSGLASIAPLDRHRPPPIQSHPPLGVSSQQQRRGASPPRLPEYATHRSPPPPSTREEKSPLLLSKNNSAPLPAQMRRTSSGSSYSGSAGANETGSSSTQGATGFSAGPTSLHHGTFFGQPPMHPSLAGLPGAGGGPGSKQQPSFVCKLYTILEDEAIQGMIAWVNDGTAFRVSSPSEFSRVVLPTYFKHANWQSFVRQLNMYGFHKVTSAIPINPEENVSAIWEFRHPSFRRGDVHLLSEIKRKSSRGQKGGLVGSSQRNESPDSTGQSQNDPNGGGGMAGSPGMTEMRSSHAASGQPAYPDEYHRTSHEGYQDEPHGMPHYPPPPEHMRRGEHHPAYASADGRASMDGYRGAVLPAGARGEYDSNRGHSPSAGGGAGIRVAFDRHVHHNEARLEDLSDRVDAIIRHSSYLESQLRTVSEELRVSRKNEQLLRIHFTRSLERLETFCSSLHRAPAERETHSQVQIRTEMLDAIHREVEALHSI